MNGTARARSLQRAMHALTETSTQITSWVRALKIEPQNAKDSRAWGYYTRTEKSQQKLHIPNRWTTARSLGPPLLPSSPSVETRRTTRATRGLCNEESCCFDLPSKTQ
jgi:hypothetical protein